MPQISPYDKCQYCVDHHAWYCGKRRTLTKTPFPHSSCITLSSCIYYLRLMKSNSMSVTVSLEDAAHSRCHILLYSKVENAAEVRQLIMKGQVEASLIKPAMVVDTFQVIVAANKAVRSLAAKKMVTRSVFAEIIFNLSPTKNITDSLKNFGLGDGDTEILAVVLDEESGEKVKKLKSQIRGEFHSSVVEH
ncbi:EKC/KEOPS complex subunit Tprkb-like isoform X2 [Homarus americanus]|uniref:EKC/KEOPS complex subunit Tprkb-like isoform X2 n=1 Tax=Homarus americanus TaxID=6706 RepID=UPI001C45DFD6|nr:EKC/KEOPS complex subunit Tprkb-like isoform X2 [Homarus americanus]